MTIPILRRDTHRATILARFASAIFLTEQHQTGICISLYLLTLCPVTLNLMKAAVKQRTKCFTGCWTCRSRRVKCDEATPLCQRCRQFGVQCGGYGVRLSWVQYDPPLHAGSNIEEEIVEEQEHASRTSRRALGAAAVPRLSSPDLDTALRSIDEWCSTDSTGMKYGGFSVFSVQPANSEDMLSALTSIDTVAASPDDIIGIVSHHIADVEDRSELILDNLGDDEAGITYQSDSVLPLARTLLCLGWEGGNANRDSGQQQQRLHQQYQSRSSPKHLDVLPMPANQKRLIHHWVTFTSRKLVLLDEPHNPCRTMMLPMALKGLVSSSAGSNSDVAIFHALCASSAYNLFELGGRTNEQDHALALSHDQQAIQHLRHNLDQVNEHQDASFAMAIMACIAVEAISGTTQRWRTHVSGGLAYLSKLQARGLDEAVLSPFRCHMLSMAILCAVPVPDDLKPFLSGDGLGENLEFTFPYYGVSKSFLQAQHKMNEYAAVNSKVSLMTPDLEKELDSFELQLYLHFPGLPPQDQRAGASQSNSGIIAHMARTFYYAGLIFFQRSIRSVPLSEVQSLVDLGVSELESIERVGMGELGCMMLWPVLVIGAECGRPDVQQRMTVWFRGQQKLGFRNLTVIESLIAMVWKTRLTSTFGDCGLDVDWREFIVQDRFDVFRL